MKKRFISNLILLMVGMSACKPTEKSAVGLYRSSSPGENGLILRLKANHRYEFYAYREKDFVGNQGKWQRSGQDLFLNSEPALKGFPWLVTTGTAEADSVEMHVCYHGNRLEEGIKKVNSIAGAAVKVKIQGQWLQLQTNQRGFLKLPREWIDSVEVQAVGMKPLTQLLGLKPTRHLHMILEKENSERIRFFNEKWQLKGTRRIIARINNEQIIFKKGSKRDYYRFQRE